MTAKIEEAVVDGVLRGDVVARHVRVAVAEQVAQLRHQGISLTLAVVRVGDDPASEVYVRHKIKACTEVGISSRAVVLPGEIAQDELLSKVAELDEDDTVDGILVQLPLPDHIDATRVIEAISPRKDVDGFHPVNLGLLMGGRPLLQACTPAGVMVLLEAAGVDLRGKRAVVVGRSVIVGRPMAQMLLRAHATVTVCHRHTVDLEGEVRRADIVIVATGVPGLVRGEWIQPGAVVIDVGINRGPDGRLCGDVDFDGARERAALVTPVPRGVGPMTVAMLLWNTVLAARFRRDRGDGDAAGPLSPFGE